MNIKTLEDFINETKLPAEEETVVEQETATKNEDEIVDEANSEGLDLNTIKSGSSYLMSLTKGEQNPTKITVTDISKDDKGGWNLEYTDLNGDSKSKTYIETQDIKLSELTNEDLETEDEDKIDEAKADTVYTIETQRKGRKSYVSGTLDYLKKYFSYTIEKGKSWESEKGNKKINKDPKNINSFVKTIYDAENNAAANGYSGIEFTLVDNSMNPDYTAATNEALSDKQKEYRDFFMGKLEDFGKGSPAEMNEDEKKKFFNQITSDWKSTNEEVDINEDADVSAIRYQITYQTAKLRYLGAKQEYFRKKSNDSSVSAEAKKGLGVTYKANEEQIKSTKEKIENLKSKL